MSQDRRLNYRVTPTIEREVTVNVVLPSGDSVDLALIDISAGGVGMAGMLGEDPPLQEGDSIIVCFTSKRLLHPLEIPSQVRHIKIVDDAAHYGISFDEWGGARSHLAPKLRSLFNEREAVRVEPRPEEDVVVHIGVPTKGGVVEGWLRDISVLGVGMWITAEDQVDLEDRRRVQIQFTLPQSKGLLELEVHICHQQVVGDRTRLGLQIVNDQPGRWNGVHREITQYVMSRQIEVARIDAERKRAMNLLTESVSEKE